MGSNPDNSAYVFRCRLITITFTLLCAAAFVLMARSFQCDEGFWACDSVSTTTARALAGICCAIRLVNLGAVWFDSRQLSLIGQSSYLPIPHRFAHRASVHACQACCKVFIALCVTLARTETGQIASSILILVLSSTVLLILLTGQAGYHHKNQQVLCASYATVWWTHVFHALRFTLPQQSDEMLSVWLTGLPLSALLFHWICLKLSARSVFSNLWDRFLNAQRSRQHLGTFCHKQMTSARKMRCVNLTKELVGMNNTGLSTLFQVLGTARVQTVTGIDTGAGAGALFLRLDSNALRPQHMQLILAAVSTNPVLTIGAISFDFNKCLLKPPSRLLELEQRLERGQSLHNARGACCLSNLRPYPVTEDSQSTDRCVTQSPRSVQGSPMVTPLKDTRRVSSSSLIPQLLLHATDAAGPNTGTMASLDRRLWGLGSFLSQYEPLVCLSMRGVNMPPPVFDALCDALRLSSVKVLDLSGCSLTAAHASSLGGLLEDSTTLRKLSISCNPKLGAGGGTVIARGIASITFRAQLDFLDASWCRLRLEGVEALLQAIDHEACGIRAVPPRFVLHSNGISFEEYKLLFEANPDNLEDYSCLRSWADLEEEASIFTTIPSASVAETVVKDLNQHMIASTVLGGVPVRRVSAGLQHVIEAALGQSKADCRKQIRSLLPSAALSHTFFDQLLLSVIVSLQPFSLFPPAALCGFVERFHRVKLSVMGSAATSNRTGSSLSAVFAASPRSTAASWVSGHSARGTTTLNISGSGSVASQGTAATRHTAGGTSQNEAADDQRTRSSEISSAPVTNKLNDQKQGTLRKHYSAHTMLRLLSSRTAVGDWLADHENQSLGSTPRSVKDFEEADVAAATADSHYTDSAVEAIVSAADTTNTVENALSKQLDAVAQIAAGTTLPQAAGREMSVAAAILPDDRDADELRRKRSGHMLGQV